MEYNTTNPHAPLMVCVEQEDAIALKQLYPMCSYRIALKKMINDHKQLMQKIKLETPTEKKENYEYIDG